MIYKTSNRKLMIEQHKPHKDIGDELTFSEWVENPAHSVASVTGTQAVILIKKNVSQYKI
jgi:hypothetical protein